jgi:hypothetical protein
MLWICVSVLVAVLGLTAWAETPSHSPPGLERTLAGTAATFDEFGAIGDGNRPDETGMQAAVDAGAGGTVYGVSRKTYTLRGQVYVPSNTTIDCRGATVQFDPALGSTFVNAMFWVGYGNGKGASNVEIRNCNFQSDLGGNGYSAIMFQPGSSNIKIHGNNFRNIGGRGLAGVALRTSRLSDIEVYGNKAEDIEYLFYLDGNENHTHHHCVAVPSGKPCTNAANPPPPNTIKYQVPPHVKSDIAAGDGYGVIVYRHDNGNGTFRLYGPYDQGSDFTYADGVIEFSSAANPWRY